MLYARGWHRKKKCRYFVEICGGRFRRSENESFVVVCKLSVFTSNKVTNEFEVLEYFCPGDACTEGSGAGNAWESWSDSRSPGWGVGSSPLSGPIHRPLPVREARCLLSASDGTLPLPGLFGPALTPPHHFFLPSAVTWPCELGGETREEIEGLLFHQSRKKQHFGGEWWILLWVRCSSRQVSPVLMTRRLPLPDRWLSLFKRASAWLMAGSPCPAVAVGGAVFLLLLMSLICWPQDDPAEVELKLTCHFL